MTRVGIRDTVEAARSRGAAVGAYNVVLLEHAEAIVAGAERAGAPVILQISENCVRYHGALAPITLATIAIARAASVPAFVHLDHIESAELVFEGLELGIDSLMFDASRLDYADNVSATRGIVERAHARGVVVEAELGEVGGKDGVHAPGARTDPGEAAAFVQATGVDLLAVAVGTSHAMQERTGHVDRELIAALRAAVPVPLVLHGSSGLDDSELSGAVAAGMAKINISTHLNGLFTGQVRRVLDGGPAVTDPRTYVAPAREAVAAEVARLTALLAA
ncbi:class II fructose-bisphosphate aldolase [Gryllotalpicola daejeonensis]|uniref:Class II fructose-bisphosphate aldolase n=1 Tax=Gryllotalpicola daejeonensis TaxID=993087 RepID=A0ABP7ZNV2_9MICO